MASHSRPKPEVVLTLAKINMCVISKAMPTLSRTPNLTELIAMPDYDQRPKMPPERRQQAASPLHWFCTVGR